MFNQNCKQRAKNNNFFLEKRRVFITEVPGHFTKLLVETPANFLNSVIDVGRESINGVVDVVKNGTNKILIDPGGNILSGATAWGSKVADRTTDLAFDASGRVINSSGGILNYGDGTLTDSVLNYPIRVVADGYNSADLAINGCSHDGTGGMLDMGKELLWNLPKRHFDSVVGFGTNIYDNTLTESGKVWEGISNIGTSTQKLFYDTLNPKNIISPIKAIKNIAKDTKDLVVSTAGTALQTGESLVKLPVATITDGAKTWYDLTLGNNLETARNLIQQGKNTITGAYGTVVSPLATVALPRNAAADDYKKPKKLTQKTAPTSDESPPANSVQQNDQTKNIVETDGQKAKPKELANSNTSDQAAA